tara:strand:- start:841 stop:1320 length:480 start_codon:yes stop_codon:yes gene_type:complete
VLQSVLDKAPVVLTSAVAIDIAGVVPPEEAIGELPDTPVTVPLPLLLNVDQSVEDKAPLLDAEAVGTFKVITAVPEPPLTVLDKFVPVVPNVKAATLVTVPVVELVPAPIAVLKLEADNVSTVSSAFNLINLIAVIFGTFNKFFPIEVVALVPNERELD